jgi:uncharacterized protein (TIGR02147 family)
MKNRINIFEYLNYRQFIADWVKREKELDPKFSYRYFNRQVGINSSSFLPLLINGSRNIGKEGITAIIKGFRLNEREGKYFEYLVDYDQSETPLKKNEALKKINKYNQRAKEMAASHYNLFSKWYYAAILEMLRLDTKKKKDLNFIVKNIKPSIGKVIIKKAVNELIDLGLITEGKKGYEVDYSMLTTPEDYVSIAICNLQAEMSALASKSVMTDPADEREFSALTIAISRETYSIAKKKIQEFRKELHRLLETDGKGKKEMVCQFNFQQFQLTQINQSKGKKK